MKYDIRSKALSQPLAIADDKRFDTFDDNMSCSDEAALSAKDIDRAAESFVYCSNLAYDIALVQRYSIDLPHYIPKPSNYDQVYTEVITLDPSLKQLVMDIRSIEPPHKGEIPPLQVQIANGNQYARSRMIEMYMRVALKVALVHIKAYDLNPSDTIERAFFALIKAVDDYGGDQSKSQIFSSYIANEIYRNMIRDLDVLKPIQDYLYRRMNQANIVCLILNRNGCTECERFHDCNTVRLYIQRKLKCDDKLCEEVLNIILKPLSIEKIEKDYRRILYNYEEEGIIPEGAFYPYHLQYKDDMDGNLDDKFRDEWVQTIVRQKLNTKEARIIEGRLGLNGSGQMTLTELGREFHLSRERIRQIEVKSLKTLTYAFRRNKLATFIQKYDEFRTIAMLNKPDKDISGGKVPKKRTKSVTDAKSRLSSKKSSAAASQAKNRTSYQQRNLPSLESPVSKKKAFEKLEQESLLKSITKEEKQPHQKESNKKGKKRGPYTKWWR